MKQLKIGIIASHGGSNAQIIIDAINNRKLNAEISLIISNNSHSKVLEKARNLELPWIHLSGKTNPNNLDDAFLEVLKKFDVNLVCLAGYMKKLGPKTISAYNNKILNIHPSLLPKHGGKGMYGMKVHESVLHSKDKTTGATIHLINSEHDKGKIIAQKELLILPNDNVNSLSNRVLKLEHKIYIETLQKIISGQIII